MFSAIAALAVSSAGCSSTQDQTSMPAVQPAIQRAERTRIREFNDLMAGSPYYGPAALVPQPKGELWVADNIDQDFGESAILEISTSGEHLATHYYQGVTSQGSSFADIVKGPDRALWITDEYNQQILRMSTGGSYTAFPLPGGGFPAGIAVGRDRALWFTYTLGSRDAIGRLTTAGKFILYTAGLSQGVYPRDIAAGPDGAMWFTEFNAGRIGRITMHGKIKEYSSGISSGAEPNSIVAGPDGALWFTETAGRIGRITTAGSVTEYSQGITSTEGPFGITAGPRNTLWFTEYEGYGSSYHYNAKIGSITTGGTITEYSGLDSGSVPTDIVEGSDGNIWFVDTELDLLGRVTL
jgi:virginiamycin B lyase